VLNGKPICLAVLLAFSLISLSAFILIIVFISKVYTTVKSESNPYSLPNFYFTI
jgi:hypothetical protein